MAASRKVSPLAYSLRLPLLFLRGHSVRLGLAIVALAIAVAGVAAIDLVNRAVLLTFTEVVDTMAGRAALQVNAGEDGLFPEDVATQVASVPGVELAVPVVTATAFTTDDSGEVLSVLGVDVADESAVRIYETSEALIAAPSRSRVKDPLGFLNQPDSVAVTRVFASQRGLEVGDELPLETATGRRRFVVRGLLEAEGVARAFGGNLVVMDVQAAEEVFTRPGFVTRVDVVVKRGADRDAVTREVQKALPAGLRVTVPEQRKADLHRVIRSLEMLLWGVAVIAVVLCFLVAFNRLATHFEARTWQAGILRAVGARAGAVWWELVKESLVLGAAGVLVGVPLGILLGRVLLPFIATTASVNFKFMGPSAQLAVRTSSLCLGAAVGLAAAVLAAALPAWRAARESIAQTVRRRGIEQRDRPGRSALLTRGAFVVGVLAAVVLQAVTESPVWGLVATALIAGGATFAARPLFRLVQRPLGPVLFWLAGPTGPFAWSNILHNQRRTALTIGLVGLGLGSVLWLLTIANSFERTLIHAQAGAVRADFVVTPAGIASGWVAAPVDESLLDDLRTVPGVEAVAGNRLREWPHHGESVAINAFDPAYFESPEFGRWLLLEGGDADEVWRAVARGEGVVVSTSFPLHFGTRVHNTLVLETPTGPLPLPVLGITMDFASPGGTVEISRALYSRHWNDSHVNRVWVRAEPGADLAALRTALARDLRSKYTLRVFSSGEMVDYWVAQIRRGFAGVDVLRAVVFLVMLLGIADTLASGVVQRTRELGAARAVGIRRWHLQRMVLVEALVMGGLGLVLGGVVGITMGALWIRWTFPYLLGYVLDFHLPYMQLGLIGLTTALVCAIAAVLPARGAARLEPAVALRYE